jgi:hypothetical protein
MSSDQGRATAQDFYEALSKAQSHVRNELSLVSLVSQVSLLSHDRSVRRIFKRLEAQKRYFTTLFFLRPSSANLLDDPERDIYGSFCRDRGHEETSFTISFTADDLRRLCEAIWADGPRSQGVQDAMCYSLIPTYFKFFLTEESFEAYLAFLDKQAGRPWQREFQKVLFVAPQFVNFVCATFYPVLQPILSEKVLTIEDPRPFLDACLRAWRENIALCPIHIKLFLQRMGEARERLLHDCFFVPFVDSPQYWGAATSGRRCPPTSSRTSARH